MRKIILSVSFLLTASLTLVFSLFYFQYLSDAKNNFLFINQNYRMYSALPPGSQPLKTDILGLNVRVESIENFLKTYGSPLVPFSEFIVSTSDKYGLDYRLLPAVAMQESNLCKKAPVNSFNCWGYGIYGGKVLSFSGFEEAIETVARGLAKNYKNQGLLTPKEIMTKYTPNNTNNWAYAVEYFMQKLTLF